MPHRDRRAPRPSRPGSPSSDPGSAASPLPWPCSGTGSPTSRSSSSSPGIGGTWWNNRYPGAEVDLESHIYSFSFARSDWTRTHARWDELQRYLESVVDRFGLRSHLALNEKVESVTWSEKRGEYDIVTSSGASHGAFQAVISAVGFLNIPLIPPFARGDTGFGGVICHTSAWPMGLDLAGKKVAVLGTGSSAVQVVAEAAKCAAELKIFQIEPNWLLPKGNRDFTAAERRLNRHPLVYEWRRRRLYLQYDLRQIRASHARRGGRANSRRAARRPGLPRILPGQPARPARAAHPRLPGRGPPHGHQRHLLRCPPPAERAAHTPCGQGADLIGRHRRQRRPARLRRDRPGHGFRRRELPGQLPGHRRQRRRTARAVGGRAAGLLRPHGAGLPELLHDVRAEHQRRPARLVLRGPGPVRR